MSAVYLLRQNARRRLHIRSALQIHTRRTAGIALLSSWVHWRDIWSKSRELGERSVSAVLSFRRYLVLKAFTRWLDLASSKPLSHAAFVMGRALLHHLSSQMRVWRIDAQQMRDEAERVQQCCQMHRLRCMRGAVALLRENRVWQRLFMTKMYHRLHQDVERGNVLSVTGFQCLLRKWLCAAWQVWRCFWKARIEYLQMVKVCV